MYSYSTCCGIPEMGQNAVFIISYMIIFIILLFDLPSSGGLWTYSMTNAFRNDTVWQNCRCPMKLIWSNVLWSQPIFTLSMRIYNGRSFHESSITTFLKIICGMLSTTTTTSTESNLQFDISCRRKREILQK